MKCKICGNNTEAFSTAQVLSKYQVTYFACPACQFVQTETPYWLDEAYTEPINRSDVGYVSRNVSLSRITKALISTCFRSSAQFIDYGAGYGLCTRLMRDLGFDFWRSDKYCPNLFAKDFEADEIGTKQYELLTSFEVFEHLADPLPEIERMLTFSETIFFSTELQPMLRPNPETWWYYGLNHGQHISLYSVKSLRVLADTFGYNLFSNDRNLHLLTKKSPSRMLFNLVTRNRVADLLHLLIRKQSLAPNDHDNVLRRSNAPRMK